ncbi:hypothetical protein C2E21_8960 [Chlorella sorokiniana]|uniref:UspA domain-containing protein n=1 Tax=Chlorella sorokiniana TaxID=3076 RepID=A0A2P6TD58_CHLSO|nr:hypothetical protein C2E21_8960 [Chlorella sorokiniana]|eukprot:PRW20580.1 hypothetical protein C2E21_8960 [Chlorella sorokiniana]
MSHTTKELSRQKFAFGPHTLQVVCRRLPEEVARVTQTLQLDVEELFANLLTWDTPKPAPQQPEQPQPQPRGPAGEQQQQQPRGPAGEQQQQQQEQQQDEQQPEAVDSKKLCGNVESDQPDLIGLDVWPASIALCNYLSAHASLVAGAAVCELGAGMGLPGLLCAALGARHVLLTDYEPVVVAQIQQNADLNAVAASCAYLALDWFNLAPLAPEQRHAFDLLLLADVIYAAAVVGPLVTTLRALLRPQTGVALVAHRIRRPLVFDREENIAKLQEHDEIFEDFKVACQREGLRLRFLNDSSAAALAGDEPLLLRATMDKRRVCVAVDASSTSKSALEWVGRSQLGQKMDEVRLFTVVPPSTQNEMIRSGHFQGTYSTHPETEADPAELERSKQLLRESRERLVGLGVKDSRIDTTVVVASAGDSRSIGREISNYAEDCGCETVVLGSRGLGITKRALLNLLAVGSVSDYVVHHSKCNVVVHKDPKAVKAAGLAQAQEQ